MVIDESISTSPLLLVFQLHLGAKLFMLCGYKYGSEIATHPFRMRLEKQIGTKMIQNIDFANYAFNDGTHIHIIPINYEEIKVSR